MKKIILILALSFLPTLAQAQSQRNPCYNSASTSNPTNQNCIPVGTNTPLPVTGTFTPSGTQTVTGTVAATQSGTWTVQPGNTANTTPWLVQSAGQSFTNITTNANTVIKASAGTFGGIVVNTAGATSNAIVYNNTTCTGAIIGTFSTLAQTVLNINAAAGIGICVTTAGGTPADITILWR